MHITCLGHKGTSHIRTDSTIQWTHEYFRLRFANKEFVKFEHEATLYRARKICLSFPIQECLIKHQANKVLNFVNVH